MILAKVSNFLSLISSSRKSYGQNQNHFPLGLNSRNTDIGGDAGPVLNQEYPCVSTSHNISIFFYYRFRILHKDFGASHLVLVVIHVDGAKEVKHPLLFRSPPVRPCLSC